MKKFLTVFWISFGSIGMALGQQHVSLNVYNKQKEVTAGSSITLTNGFSVPLGASFSAYISPANGGVQNNYDANKGYNYVITHQVRVAGIVNPWDSTNLNSHVNTTIAYVDGWGREAGTVAVRASPGQNSILQRRDYDELGLEGIKYLPYTKSGELGHTRPTTFDAQAFYTSAAGVVHTAYPFSETRFEQSPLNRVLEQGAAGDYWQLSSSSSPHKGHTLSWSYDPHRREALYKVAISATGVRTLVRPDNNRAVYARNALTRTVSRDENNSSNNGFAGSVLECRDRDDQVVLKRSYNQNGATTDTLSTYYVYDDFHNLCFVLPPAASPDNNAAISQTTLDNYCYQYKYDGRQRMTAKKLPGKGWEYMVYNKLDQLIMTQDGVQRGISPQQWTVSKYDVQGRVVLTGIFTHTGSTANTDYLSTIQAAADLVSAQWESRTTSGNGYTSNTYPQTPGTILSISYYDDYAVPGLPSDGVYNQSAAYSKMTRGLATAAKVNVLGTSNYLWHLSYYDDEGRVVKSVQQHYKGAGTGTGNYDEISSSYDFTGQLTASVRKHYLNGAESLYIKNTYSYDAWGRKVDTYQTTGSTSGTIANTPVLLSRNVYNEIGQLQQQRLHSTNQGSSFAQDVSYSYNERGWLTAKSAPLFTETLRYQESISGASPQYNGNISRQEWTGGKYYNYSYDKLNRLSSAVSSTGNNELVGYDLMGNISRLQRKQGGSLVDQLKYSYSGNRLSSVLDSNANASADFQLSGTTSYSYDVNGSMSSRSNTAHTANNLTGISYNVLNLPKALTSNGGTITYSYDAEGNKLRKVVGSSVDNDYISGIQYNKGDFDFAQTETGRVRKNGSGPDPGYLYEYTLSDHLGNGRVFFDINNGSARGIQQTDYYGFGLALTATPILSMENKYQYNGKEKQDQEKMFDYGARFYDPVIGRWNVIDPLAEKLISMSPYTYGANNPTSMIDNDGRYAVSVHYNITYKVLLALGYSKKEADVMAHYSSTYADHPSNSVRFADFMLHPLEMNTHNYRVGPNYENTKDSQLEKNSTWHSMMSDAEAEGGMTQKQALARGLKFGWDNVFSSDGGKDLGKLGQGIHALQDAIAHGGMSTSSHLGKNWSSVKQTLGIDMYGSTEEASSLTRSAGIVTRLMAGKSVTFKKDEELNFRGMSKNQLTSTISLLMKQGFTGTIRMN